MTSWMHFFMKRNVSKFILSPIIVPSVFFVFTWEQSCKIHSSVCMSKSVSIQTPRWAAGKVVLYEFSSVLVYSWVVGNILVSFAFYGRTRERRSRILVIFELDVILTTWRYLSFLHLILPLRHAETFSHSNSHWILDMFVCFRYV